MQYSKIKKGIFISRPNRFIALVDIGKDITECHVKSTGRLKELLAPGSLVYLDEAQNPKRKTKYDLVAVNKAGRIVNIDSSAPQKAFTEHLLQGKFISQITVIKPEAKFKDSRFDYLIQAEDAKIFIELKGVTLEEDGIAMFPDAPTMRGIKHLNRLAEAVGQGYMAHVVFIAQMGAVKYFTPNSCAQPAFRDALASAVSKGVIATAFSCDATESGITIAAAVPIRL
jgi:sugar fermentation stimulation protein A